MICGIGSCVKYQEQKKTNFINYQLQRTGSCSSVPPGPSSPSLTSLSPSGSASPQHSDRPNSAKNFIQNNSIPVLKSPSRVRFDLRPQIPQDMRPRPRPPMRNPPPPPSNVIPEPTTPAENIYETVIMPSQLSNSSSQEYNKPNEVKRNRRKLKKRTVHNNGQSAPSEDYIITSDSSSDDEIEKKSRSSLVSPSRSRSAECHARHRLRNNHYSRGPSDVHRCSSCNSTSSDSDDAYMTEYLTESLSRIQITQQCNQVCFQLINHRINK